MTRKRCFSLFIIGIFYIISIVASILLSQKSVKAGLWIMPALFHLYPIVTFSVALLYSIITSKKILWMNLLILIAIGLLLECFLFRLANRFIFYTPRSMALFILGLLVFVYGSTWSVYFYIVHHS